MTIDKVNLAAAFATSSSPFSWMRALSAKSASNQRAVSASAVSTAAL